MICRTMHSVARRRPNEEDDERYIASSKKMDDC